MAELEIHHEHGHEEDPLGRTVGIMAAFIAIFLAIVSIAGHRAHTEAVLLKADSADRWSYYESNRTKIHTLELGADILSALGSPAPDTPKKLQRYASDQKKYEERSKVAMEEAKHIQHESALVEEKALKFDYGEGFLEIGVVMSSIYFISKKKLFPVIGVLAAASGLVLGAWGFLM